MHGFKCSSIRPVLNCMYYIFANKFFLGDCDANFIAEGYLVHVLENFPD